MNLKKHVVRSFICSVPLFLIAAGCNNAPQYKYQSASNVAINEGGGSGASGAHKEGSVSVTTETRSAPAVAELAAPTVPEVSVGELLQNSNSYDNKKIKVTGRKGKLLPHYNMAYMINNSDDSYIAFSYEQMSNPEKGTLSRLNTLQGITVSGVWNASKKMLVGEELILSSM